MNIMQASQGYTGQPRFVSEVDKYIKMMVVGDAKDGGAEEIDPLDDSEGKESGRDFKSYVVKGIIDNVVEQTFSFLVELKHNLC